MVDTTNRDHNIEVFSDTFRRCSEDSFLRSTILKSIKNQIVILENEDFTVEENRKVKTECTVSKLRTMEAASKYKNGKTTVLNFANWYYPGGGVQNGCSAQEEALCRVSTLYPCICSKDAFDRFYYPHRSNQDYKANDDLIITPDVLVFKGDDYPNSLLSKEQCFMVDVITCAAPNLCFEDLSNEELYSIHKKRFERIIKAANLVKTDNLILGAFGCGAFDNEPHVVAAACKEALLGSKRTFCNVEFAIYCRQYETYNYTAFEKEFGERCVIN